MNDTQNIESSPSESKKPPRRRWRFQFSLRSLLIFVSVCGALSGWIGTMLKRVHDQRAVVKKIQNLGGEVYYDYQKTEGRWGIQTKNEPPGPRWLRWMLGDDFFANAEYVFFNSLQIVLKEEDLALLRDLPNIKDIAVFSPGITDQGLEILGSLPNLEGLNLSDAKSITGEGLGRLENAQKLKSLTLYGVAVNDSTVAHIDKLANLQSLQLVKTSVTDDGLASIARLSHLKYLDIFLNGSLTYKSLNSIGQLQSLESLCIIGNSAFDRDFDRLKALHKLKTLKINSCSFHDEDMEILSEFKELTVLHLSGSLITDDGMVHLQSLTKLQELNLSNTQIGNPGLAHLKPLTNLEQLSLSSTKIDKDGLKQLECLSKLQYFEVGPGIAKPDLMEMRNRLPKCMFQILGSGGIIEYVAP
jgi:Leucine-rich repeat (LRR) protein